MLSKQHLNSWTWFKHHHLSNWFSFIISPLPPFITYKKNLFFLFFIPSIHIFLSIYITSGFYITDKPYNPASTMASTSNSTLSSKFLGTQLVLLSPPTPKTSSSLPSLSRKKMILTQTALNNKIKKPNSALQDLSTNATLATLLLSSISPQALALNDTVSPPSPAPSTTVLEAENPVKSSPFSQTLSLNAPVTKGASSDLPEGTQWRYSEFLNAVKKGKVERVRFNKEGGVLQLTAVDGRRASVVVPNDPDLVDILAMNGVDISVSEGESSNGLVGFIGNLLFPVIAFAGLFFLFRRGQGGPGGPGGLGGPMDFGRSKSKFQEVPETGVTFADVAGADQAKLELQEVVDFLKNPDKYTALGAKIPKGCLLVGPPGTGKTLLARAVAGEAGTPFFSCAASEFVELFVGVGASRVRDLFEKAKAKAPCIVFIDEIDAVGRQRGAGMGGGNDEREQTINQLLTEMDGFSGNSGVIVLAATNRPDVLDSALLRPGRFDRQVTVDRPDVAGRVKILQVHSRGKSLAKDVDFDKIARRTPGFTGADLQNLMNEAAILAARRDLKEISKDEIADALERIIAGPEKKNAVVSEEKKKLVAYHEAGHALVGALMPEYDPVAKISIIPRGQAGGLTFFAPSEERLESGLYSRSYLENQMAVALGGRVAEEVIFGKENVTTGASNDFMQVSRVARQMVERFGFSKKIGQVAVGGAGGNPFLGQQMSSQKDYSMATADIVDSEVRELVEKAYARATEIVNTHIDILHKLAQLLIEKESVDGEEFMSLFIDGKAELYVA
nr:PREDICTED: ATP-dependent zinc metalloprotease FTSH, chloroplastic [Daucus carota subsp. sativus]